MSFNSSCSFDLVKKEILQTNIQSPPKRTTGKNKAFIMDLNESNSVSEYRAGTSSSPEKSALSTSSKKVFSAFHSFSLKKEILQTNIQSPPKRTTGKNKAFIMDLNESVTSQKKFSVPSTHFHIFPAIHRPVNMH